MNSPSTHSFKPRQRGQGFTLIEILMAGSVLVVAILGLLSSMLSASTLQRDTGDSLQAFVALSQTLEDIQATQIRSLKDTYGTGSFGSTFDVYGLDIIPGDPNGQVGSVQLYFDETEEDAELGLPRDLDGDGEATATDITAGRMILVPVRVTVRWQGVSGKREISMVTCVARR